MSSVFKSGKILQASDSRPQIDFRHSVLDESLFENEKTSISFSFFAVLERFLSDRTFIISSAATSFAVNS